MTRPPKKSKAPPADFTEAQRACRTPAEREQLAIVVSDKWTPAELREYARLYFFKNGRDYPTATSYRRAIADIARCGTSLRDVKPSYAHPCGWLKLFRRAGSKPLPPRREGLLLRGRDLGQYRVDSEEYAWPGHTEEFRAMIEQRARDYFVGIAPGRPVHVNAWAASKRAYDREQDAAAEKLRKETEAVAFSLSPKSRKNSPKAARRKLAPQFDYDFMGRPKLKPHFDYEFPGHTEAFREEVAALARKGKKPDAYISPRAWKIACHKHYVLIDTSPAQGSQRLAVSVSAA